MQTQEHKYHIQSRNSHNNCQECRADTERRFVDTAQWRYEGVGAYLAYVTPLLALIRAGNQSVEAQRWLREFRLALHRRIGLKAASPKGRKYCNSYLERMGQFRRDTDATYLRRYAARGASCLN